MSGYLRFAQLGGVTFNLGPTAGKGGWVGTQVYLHRPVLEDCGVAARGDSEGSRQSRYAWTVEACPLE